MPKTRESMYTMVFDALKSPDIRRRGLLNVPEGRQYDSVASELAAAVEDRVPGGPMWGQAPKGGTERVIFETVELLPGAQPGQPPNKEEGK